MKKTLLLISAIALSSTVFAQNAVSGQSFASFKEGDKALGQAVSSKLSAAKETQTTQAAAASASDYKLGNKIDLMALKGKEATVRIAPVAGKAFKVEKATESFDITYSQYSYKFNYSVEKDGSLAVKITPVLQNEQLWPTADVRFEIHGNTVTAVYHAVTMDDVNNGMGWGIHSDVATLTDAKQAGYQLGTKIDLTALNGKETTIRIAPVTGKTFKLDKAASSFDIAYSQYSYKFNYSLEKDGALAVKITPVLQSEHLWPTATVRFEIHNNVLSSAFNAVTIDDVNDGLGWGVNETVALLK